MTKRAKNKKSKVNWINKIEELGFIVKDNGYILEIISPGAYIKQHLVLKI